MVLLAMPTEGVAGQGFTQVVDGKTTTYTQTVDKVYNEVDRYSIAIDEIHRYSQPSSDAIFLQRVVGQDPSSILGQLIANGQVWVMNPSGLLVGADARINTAGFLGTSLVMDQDDFFAGRYNLYQDGDGGYVVNKGEIIVNNGGYAILAGGSVVNDGLVAAEAGEVVLASGRAMSFDFDGDGLINFAVDDETAAAITGPDGADLTSAVLNTGDIKASRVLMTAQAARDIFDAVVNNEGIIEATSVSAEGGVIKLLGGDEGAVLNTGTLDASGDAEGATGGTVQVLGEMVGLLDGTEIDVSGDSGGGTVLVGGDYQGKNPDMQNASKTYVASEATIKADALTEGDGGKVIIWADESTCFDGSISARGGAIAGDGGFVEVSGKDELASFSWNVDLTAPAGTAGTLLLDPTNIMIRSGNDDGTDGTQDVGTAGTDEDIWLSHDSGDANDGSIDAGDTGTGADPFEVWQSEIEGSSGTIVLAATNDIYDRAADVGWTLSLGGDSLTLTAGGSITLTRMAIGSGNAVTLNAGTNITLGRYIDTVSSLDVNFGSSGAGTFQVNGGILATGAVTIDGVGGDDIVDINNVVTGGSVTVQTVDRVNISIPATDAITATNGDINIATAVNGIWLDGTNGWVTIETTGGTGNITLAPVADSNSDTGLTVHSHGATTSGTVSMGSVGAGSNDIKVLAVLAKGDLSIGTVNVSGNSSGMGVLLSETGSGIIDIQGDITSTDGDILIDTDNAITVDYDLTATGGSIQIGENGNAGFREIALMTQGYAGTITQTGGAVIRSTDEDIYILSSGDYIAGNTEALRADLGSIYIDPVNADLPGTVVAGTDIIAESSNNITLDGTITANRDIILRADSDSSGTGNIILLNGSVTADNDNNTEGGILMAGFDIVLDPMGDAGIATGITARGDVWNNADPPEGADPDPVSIALLASNDIAINTNVTAAGNLVISADADLSLVDNNWPAPISGTTNGPAPDGLGGGVYISTDLVNTYGAGNDLLLHAGDAITVSGITIVTAGATQSITLDADGSVNRSDGGDAYHDVAGIALLAADDITIATNTILDTSNNVTDGNVRITADYDFAAAHAVSGAQLGITNRSVNGSGVIQNDGIIFSGAGIYVQGPQAITIPTDSIISANGDIFYTSTASSISVSDNAVIQAGMRLGTIGGEVQLKAATTVMLADNIEISSGTISGTGGVTIIGPDGITVGEQGNLTANGGSVSLSAADGAIDIDTSTDLAATLDVVMTAETAIIVDGALVPTRYLDVVVGETGVADGTFTLEDDGTIDVPTSLVIGPADATNSNIEIQLSAAGAAGTWVAIDGGVLADGDITFDLDDGVTFAGTDLRISGAMTATDALQVLLSANQDVVGDSINGFYAALGGDSVTVNTSGSGNVTVGNVIANKWINLVSGNGTITTGSLTAGANNNYAGTYAAIKIDTDGNAVIGGDVTATVNSGLNIWIDPAYVSLSGNMTADGNIWLSSLGDIDVNGVIHAYDSTGGANGNIYFYADDSGINVTTGGAFAGGDGTGNLNMLPGSALIAQGNVILGGENLALDGVTAGGTLAVTTDVSAGAGGDENLTLNGDLFAAGGVTLADAAGAGLLNIDLTNDISIRSTNSPISMNTASLDGACTLSVNPGTSTVVLGIVGTNTPVESIVVNAGTITLNGAITADGSIDISTLTGDIAIAAASMTSNNGSIMLDSGSAITNAGAAATLTAQNGTVDLQADTGIGAVGAAVSTNARFLEASTDSGTIVIAETDGVTLAAGGLTTGVAAADDITLTAGGNIDASGTPIIGNGISITTTNNGSILDVSINAADVVNLTSGGTGDIIGGMITAAGAVTLQGNDGIVEGLVINSNSTSTTITAAQIVGNVIEDAGSVTLTATAGSIVGGESKSGGAADINATAAID
ncbi:MAG: filamentous hemagglutinin N-terminal domain-containing protein, partial [Deltaproteobacteria bacterium]|nr:filamentous hemagglutinin N-terminal domain-containing protein [Candidatus Anaeroferrophillacea bacterium]